MVLAVAGLLEIIISAILFALGIYIPAVSFGVAALFIALIANAIRNQGQQMARRRGEPVTPPTYSPQTLRLRRAAFVALILLGIGLLAAGVMYLLAEEYMAAITFATWVLAGAVVAGRLRH
jgi:hypothetical protein